MLDPRTHVVEIEIPDSLTVETIRGLTELECRLVLEIDRQLQVLNYQAELMLSVEFKCEAEKALLKLVKPGGALDEAIKAGLMVVVVFHDKLFYSRQPSFKATMKWKHRVSEHNEAGTDATSGQLQWHELNHPYTTQTEFSGGSLYDNYYSKLGLKPNFKHNPLDYLEMDLANKP